MPLAWKLIESRADYDRVLTSSHAFVAQLSRRPARRRTSATATRRCATPGCPRSTRAPGDRCPASRPRLRRCGAGTGARRKPSITSPPTRPPSGTASASLRPRRRGHPPPGRHRLLRPSPQPRERSGALAVSRFVPYKSVDLAIEACAAAGVPLTVAGAGPEEESLRALAAELAGRGQLRDLALRRAAAGAVPGQRRARLPRRRGLRDHPGRGAGVRRAGCGAGPSAGRGTPSCGGDGPARDRARRPRIFADAIAQFVARRPGRRLPAQRGGLLRLSLHRELRSWMAERLPDLV